MILGCRAILAAMDAGAIVIRPFSTESLGAAHVDLHLGELPNSSGRITLAPRTFLVAKTAEHIKLSSRVCGFVEGRARLAKLGVSVEQSSTFVEPGSDNLITLEVFNASDEAVVLEAGQVIGKLYFSRVTDTF